MEEEALEVVQDIPKLPLAAVLSVAFGGFIMGCTAGYVIAKRVLEPKYADRAEQEIAEAKEFYKRRYKTDEFATPSEAAIALGSTPIVEAAEALRRYQGEGEEDTSEEPPEETEAQVEVVSIWAGGQLTEITEEERQARDAGRPYVASRDEFTEWEDQQITLTYYEGDNVLADNTDEPIVSIRETVGEDSLSHFGHGSGDPKVVYVINQPLGIAFEILKHEGSFQHEVWGLQHSEKLALRDRRPLRRMRDSDDL